MPSRTLKRHSLIEPFGTSANSGYIRTYLYNVEREILSVVQISSISRLLSACSFFANTTLASLTRISHHHEQSRQILAKLPGETCAWGRAVSVGLAVAVGGAKSSNFGRCARTAIPATRRIELQQTDRSVGDRPWRKTTEVCPDLREQRSPRVALGQRDPHFAERHANLRPDL